MKELKCLYCGNNQTSKFGVGKVRLDNTWDHDDPPEMEIDYWKICGRTSNLFAHVCNECGFVMFFDENKLA